MKITKTQLREMIKEEINKVLLKEEGSPLEQIPSLSGSDINSINNWIAHNVTALKPIGAFDGRWEQENPKANAAALALSDAIKAPEAVGPDIQNITRRFSTQDRYNLVMHIKSALDDWGSFNQQRMNANSAPSRTRQESKTPSNEIILEVHRKGRKLHPAVKNNWWQNS
jgi:hypothetical protein